MLTKRMCAVAGGSIVFSLLAGCQVDSRDKGDGKEVKIATPFGGLHLTTNDKAVLEQIGLAAYPGATPVKKDKEDGAADVDMSFGGFQLRVKAVGFRTPDS